MSDGLNIPLNIQSKEAFSKLEKDAKASGAKVGSDLSSGIGGALQVGAGVLGASLLSSAFRGLTGVLSNSINAANRQEDAINSLNSALKRSGEFTDSLSKDFQDFASQLQRVSVFGDEVILEQLAFAKSLGLTSQQTKDVTQAAIELSSALGVSLESAVRNIAKTYSGLKGELGELLPTLRNVTAEQLKSGEATRIILDQFGGAAASKIETTRGAYEQLGNAFGDLTEKIGTLITKSSTVNESIKLLAGGISDLTNAIDPGGVSVSDRIGQITDSILLLESQITKFENVGASSSVIESRKKQLEGLQLQLESLRLEQRATDAVLAKERAAIPSPVQQITEEDKQKRLDAIKSIGLSEQQLLLDKLATEQELLANAAELKLISEEEFLTRSFELRRRFDEAEAAIKLSSNPLAEQTIQFDNFFEQVGAGFEGFASTVKLTGGQIAATIGNGLGRAVSSGFNAFGAALAKGENAIAAFGAAALNAIGQTISQLGQMFILKGIAYSLDPLSGGPAVGGPLIAAGAALATFGGFLSAFSGGSGGAGTSSFNNDPSASVFEQQPQIIEQEQRQEPQTAVTVNIQGDVLDSEESSLRIAELLQKAVSDQGVRFV